LAKAEVIWLKAVILMNMVTREHVADWIDKYVRAWRSPGTLILKDIFAPGATYSVSPWKPDLNGHPNIDVFWEEERNGPDEQFTIEHEVVAIENNTAVVHVFVEYIGERKSSWKDLWILIFDDNGLCASYEEWPFREGQFDGHA
jgi:hypothetical protein